MAEFKLRTDATTDSTNTFSVPVYFPYKDWYHHQDSSVALTGGKDAASLFITIPTPKKPSFGAGEMTKYELGVFVNYIDYANSYQQPEYKLYKMTEPVVKEGTFGTLDTKDILVYTMKQDNKVKIIENFKNAEYKMRTSKVAVSRYAALPIKLAFRHAKGFAFSEDGKGNEGVYETDFDKFESRYDDGTGHINLVKGRSTLNYAASIFDKREHDLYRPAIRDYLWDDPYWDADWVEDNMVTDLPPMEVEDMLFQTQDTIFDRLSQGYTHRWVHPEGNMLFLSQDEILYDDSAGPLSSVNAKFISHKQHGWNGELGTNMLATSKIPSIIPYSRQYENTDTSLKEPMSTQVTATINIKELAPACNIKMAHRGDMGGNHGTSIDDQLTGYYNTSLRGFYMVLANHGPKRSETYDSYIKRLNGAASTQPVYWNAIAFQNILNTTGPSAEAAEVFDGRIAMMSYYVAGAGSPIQAWRGDQGYVNPQSTIASPWKSGVNYYSSEWPLHELPWSYHSSWSGGGQTGDIGLPKGEFINVSIVLPPHKTYHWIVVTNQANEILAVEKGALKGSGLTNTSIPDLNYLSLWTSNVPNMQDKEAYITSTEEDPRIEVLLDSITITGATPSRKNCTVVNNQFINSINIGGEIDDSDTSHVRLFDDEKLYNNWSGNSIVLANQDRYLFSEDVYLVDGDDSSDLSDPKVKVPTYIAFGLTGNLSGDRHILFNNFKCTSESQNAAIPAANIVGWKSMSSAGSNPLGLNINKNTLITNNITSKFTVNGTKLVDYFTKKGFVTVTSGSTTLEERECIMASTRVTKYLGRGKVAVEDASLLNLADGEKFMAYVAGENYATGGYKKDLTIKALDLERNEVTFTQSLDTLDNVFADDTGIAFERNGTAQVQQITGVAADSSANYNGRWIALYDGDNRRHCFYFHSTSDTPPAYMGSAMSTTRVNYTSDDNANTMASTLGTAVHAHASFSAVVTDDDIVFTNALEGACETLELSSAWATEVSPSTAGATSDDRITDSGNGFGNFVVDQIVRVGGSTTSPNHGKKLKIKTVGVGILTLYTPTKQVVWTGTAPNLTYEYAEFASAMSRPVDETLDGSYGINLKSQFVSSSYEHDRYHRIFISPQRKWFGFEIFNYDSSDIQLPDKSYDSVLIGSTAIASQTSGPTYNERMYTDDEGYKNSWDISPEKGSLLEWNKSYNSDKKVEDDEDNYILKWIPRIESAGQVASISSTDFTLHDAFSELQYNNYGRKVVLIDDGTHTGTTTTIDDVDLSSALNKFSVASATNWAAGDMYQISKYNILDLEPMHGDMYNEGELACFYLTSTNPTDLTKTHVDTFNGSADNPPFLLTTFFDALPTVEDFSVQPDENNPFYANYTWSTNDEDLWYGFLMMDYETIDNQYKNAVFHAPLDDEAPDGDLIQNNVFEKLNITRRVSGVYSDTIPETGQFSDTFEGLAGHAKHFGSNTILRFNNSSGNYFDDCTSEMSVVAHITPDDKAASGFEYIIRYGDTGTTNYWGIYLDSDGYVNATITPRTSSTDGTTISLKSTSIVDFTGKPTCVILTVDTSLGTGNVKLFIDGKLEDQTGKKTTDGTENSWPDQYLLRTQGYLHIGAQTISSGSWPSHVTGSGFDGKIEEVVIYDKAIYPVVPTVGEFTIFKEFEELSVGIYASGRSVTARLFIKDYHNIRGKTTDEVAATGPVAWKKSGLGLDTVTQ